jgi:hypothetical protein
MVAIGEGTESEKQIWENLLEFLQYEGRGDSKFRGLRIQTKMQPSFE